MQTPQTHDDVWNKLHDNYKTRGWATKPSLFAETAIPYFPKQGTVLELGAGLGQDTRFFAEHGYDVVSTDLEADVLKQSEQSLPAALAKQVSFTQLDLREALPFADDSLDVVYAHLSFHYFDHDTTVKIFAEARRVLKPSGILAVFVNSTSDPEFGTGKQLEPNFFFVENKPKRFFDVASMQAFAKDFEVKLLDNNGETYKDMDKGVHNLIRFIGRKPSA